MTYEELEIDAQLRFHEMSVHQEPKLKLEVHPTMHTGETR